MVMRSLSWRRVHPPPTPASRPLPGPRSFSPAAGQRERAGVDGASQALLEVQEGGAGTEVAPQRGDPLCRPAGREHLLTTEYWKHFKPLATFAHFQPGL